MQIQGQPGVCIKALFLKKKKKIKPTSPSTTIKPEEISKQVSSAMGSLGLAIYLKSQRGAGDPTSWGMLQRDWWRGLYSTCILFIDFCHPKSCDRNNQKSASLSSFSEQIWQEEARRLGFNTVDPEVGTAGMVLVSSIGQLETVCL